MIIDCHGHYTTAPKALEDWRNRQIANLRTPASGPKASELRIGDDELRESIEANSAAVDEGTRCRPDHLLAARQLHGAPCRRPRDEPGVGGHLQ